MTTKPPVIIAGMWELGWNTPIMEIELWKQPLKDFGFDMLHMAPVSGIKNQFVTEYPTMEDMLAAGKGYKKVFVSEQAGTAISDFVHPKKAMYVFGKANYSPLMHYQEKTDLAVSIPTVHNKGLLWPHQVATIILHDRLIKQSKKVDQS